MEQIQLGILGLGNMGSGHLQNILDGKCPSVTVTAACDIDSAKRERAQVLCPQLHLFDNAEKLMDSGFVDALLIAVPHYDHPTYAIKAFAHGLHVLTEKPAGVFTRQVREMNEAADKAGVKFGIMFNQRTNPLFQKAKEIVQSGQLGAPKRLVWIITNWYRTQAYYNSGTWRATWNGEGGGVLLNQAPHNLDLWQWIFGMPQRIHASCAVGKYHDIHVEDDVSIFAEYGNGATAAFLTTTGEAPGTNRLEISGDLGKLVIEQGKLKWWRLAQSEREFCFAAEKGFGLPPMEYEEFTADEPEGHPIVLEKFAQSILHGTPLIADGREGLNSLMISNAAYLSSWTGEWVTLPGNEAAFEQHLAALREQETAAPAQHTAPANQEAVSSIKERWKVRW